MVCLLKVELSCLTTSCQVQSIKHLFTIKSSMFSCVYTPSFHKKCSTLHARFRRAQLLNWTIQKLEKKILLGPFYQFKYSKFWDGVEWMWLALSNIFCHDERASLSFCRLKKEITLVMKEWSCLVQKMHITTEWKETNWPFECSFHMWR